MKKYKLFLAIATVVLANHSKAQDYIITWKNDTIACELPGDAKKMGFKPAWKYEDGHEKIITVFKNDSIRIVNAGEIKGYSRKEHGKWLLCDGFFEAKQIINTAQSKRTLVEEKGSDKNLQWHFLNRIVEGKYATLYIRYDSDGQCIFAAYYIKRHGTEAENTVIPFFNKKKMIELLSESDIASEMKAFKYKKSSKGFAEIVNEYNRLKEAAAKKM